MTREDAISIMNVIVHMLEEKYDTDRVEDAVDMAIRALSAIEDIKAEIEREYLSEGHLTDYWDGIDKALEIIDKHISGSEKPNNCEDAISRAWIKEAIHNLYHYSRHTPTEEDIQEYIVDDAPPVTPKVAECEDAISRADTIEWLKRVTVTDGITFETGFKQILTDIQNMPSVTPKQKMGRWLSVGTQGEIDGQIVRAFTCSECGAISIFRMSGGNIVNGDLCPNCGAKMVEPQESEDKE